MPTPKNHWFSHRLSKNKSELNAIYQALDKSHAIIEFDLNGTILHANKNFLDTMGYALTEVVGHHHRIFAGKEYAESSEYQDFWQKLRQGQFFSSQYKRLGKNGKEVWIEATYNPILDKKGTPYKIIKFATDITEKALGQAERRSILSAIDRSQAIIHFDLDGTILEANENFLSVMGYSLKEIKGQHHSMFVESSFAESSEYRRFWEELRQGKFQSAQYKRIGKNGKEIWIEASYNPILGLNGTPCKIIKIASDLTPRKLANKQLANDFQNNIGNLVNSVGHSINQMQTTSQGLSQTASETSTRSTSVTAASEQLAFSIQHISQQTDHSSNIIQTAVSETELTGKLVEELVTSTNKITNIVELISRIAEQTNLLAMNATIEAAHAGEAGKGFAVVASEVKKLAQETATATGDIAGQISTIQLISQKTENSIQEITKIVQEIDTASSEIATSIDQQSAATREVSANILEVQQASSETGHSASMLTSVAEELSSQSTQLQDRVSNFLNKVREM